jgi:uncharacterized membrane protein YfcA
MHAFADFLPVIGLLLGIGACAGFLAGLLGVGGGIVLVPAYFFGFASLGYASPYLMQICLATSLATIIVTALRSVAAHNKKGAVEWALLKSLTFGIVLGAVLGMLTASALRSSVLQLIFGGMASCVGLYMTFGNAAWRLGDRFPQGAWRQAIAALIGFFSVLMGIGGGSLGVPTLTLYNIAIHRAVATAAGFGVIIAVPAVAGFLFADLPIEAKPPYTVGAVNIPAFFITISMTLITAPIGARVAHAIDPKPLKRVFGGFLILVALNMLRKVIWG